MNLALRLPRNEAGRDFVIGDIHGHFDRVEQLLSAVEFKCKTDRLIAVGDLVDRGPDSDQVLEWLARPGFYSVMGNHELLSIDAAGGEPLAAWNHVENGGAWLALLPEDERMEYAQAFARLPLAIEIDTAAGPVGVVHADVPAGLPWPALMKLLEAGDRGPAMQLLWSRERVTRAQRAPQPAVDGVAHVFVGHTPVKEPTRLANVHMIDLGGCFGGRMALFDAATGEEVATA